MKNAICILMICILCGSCNNQSTTTGSDALSIENETGIAKTQLSFEDTIIDFGIKPQGEVLTMDYKFKNTGKNPLIISSVRPSCGCTIADYPKEPIAPGGTGVISAVLDTKSDIGGIQKLITVHANDAARDEFLLVLKGVVAAPKNNQ